MKNLSDFIKVYDEVLDVETCDKLIEIFNNTRKNIYKNDVAIFQEVNLNLSTHDHILMRRLFDIQTQIMNQYKEEIKPFTLPKANSYEQFRIKKYEKDGVFNWHIDVADSKSSPRFLSFLYYLNDSAADTVFFLQDQVKVTPKQGTVVVFPPLWMYPHKGDLVEEEKYIMSSYLHY